MFICIHAHHSNQKWMDAALPGESLQHIVIENLLACTERLQVEKKVFEQLESLCENQKPIAIFITCTYFAAHLPKEYKVPLIPLDALLFEQLATLPAIQIVFTNPATVEPTMARYQLWQPENQQVTVHVIPNVFQYIEQEKWEEYTREITQFVANLPQEIPTAFAQLSMECAIRVSDHSCLTALPKTVQKLKSFA
ncbi:hypothetical protein AAF454_12325 [Kurthia gibsonii]|uniref:Uncharacterized protein n=1 Tax=Kurthia gibsonii TaxID=33946 RepID=A0ABU9LMH4_9BACL